MFLVRPVRSIGAAAVRSAACASRLAAVLLGSLAKRPCRIGAPLAAACLVVAAAGASPAAGRAVAVTDQLGREVTVPRPVRRIVSLAPNVTEILFALGLGERVVGVTDFCDYPPEARRIARVGGVTRPSAERVVALEPDLVLATTGGNSQDEVLGLARLGLPVVVTDPDDLEAVAGSFVLIGRAAGVPEAGARLAAAFRARVDALRQAVAGLPRPRTLLLVWPEPLVAAGPRSFLSRLLEAAGGVNALQSAGGGTPAELIRYPTIGIESFLALAPEVVVLAAPPGTDVEALAPLQRYREVPAIREGRLAAIDQAVLTRPGPRLADAAWQLARALHGGRLPEPAAPAGSGR